MSVLCGPDSTNIVMTTNLTTLSILNRRCLFFKLRSFNAVIVLYFNIVDFSSKRIQWCCGHIFVKAMTSISYIHEECLGKEESPVIYTYRWLILAIYCLINMSYGIIWVTFSPISDVASNYFHGGDFGSATAINMLGTVFLIFYIPGTILASVSLKRYKLRNTVIIGSLMTVVAALVRYIATLCYASASISTVYSLMLFGQILAAIGQPLLLNIPPVISAGWFPVGERDIAITIGAMCNSVGNAIGNVIPVELVTQTTKGKCCVGF